MALPRISIPTLVITALLAIMVVIGVASRRVDHAGSAPEARPVQVAELVMHDNPGGSISVTDAGTGRLVDTVPPDSNGFLRVVLAGLVRERRREEMGSPAIPFRIVRWSDGRLTVGDAATGRLIELAAFGPTNESAFAALLAKDATTGG